MSLTSSDVKDSQVANSKYVWVCSECKGRNIICDATVRWNVESQQWEGSPNGDGNWCEDCEEDVRFEQVQLEGCVSSASQAWPVAKEVARIGDMDPRAALRVGFDGDHDVYLSTTNGVEGVEFCTPGSGGGKSSRTREALIALMVAMEADNSADPSRDWWARRNGRAPQE